MKIPADATIAAQKITDYLLKPQPRNDKSKLLARLGFTKANPEMLEQAIRRASEQEAVPQTSTEYGTPYAVDTILIGTNQRRLRIRLVWMLRAADSKFYFVTLYPLQEEHEFDD